VKTEEWAQANAEQAAKALFRARGELYALLGGQRDPEREREALAAEVARLQLTIKPRRAYDRQDA
jgi:hypothetical protein